MMSKPDLRGAISDLNADRLDLQGFDALVARAGERIRPESEPALFSDYAAIELALAEHNSGHLDLAELRAELDRVHDHSPTLGSLR